MFVFQVPKTADGQAAQVETPQEVLGAMKQVSYKTEIIGGVPIITATQVTLFAAGGRVYEPRRCRFCPASAGMQLQM